MRFLLQSVLDAISVGSLYMILALGIALIFGIMQLVNFAHGELIMIGGYTLFVLTSVTQPLALLSCLAVVVLAALTMERVAFRPVRGANPSTLLVTSFAVSFLLQNLAILVMGGLPKGVDLLPQLTTAYHFLGLRFRQIDIATVCTTAVLVVGLTAFLSRTAIGIQMRAAAEDFRMARLLGVKANSVIATAFAMSGLLAGVAAILLIAQAGVVSPTMGLEPVLVAFTATIIGGLGNLRGAMLGGFTLGCVTVALQVGLPPALQSFREAFVFSFVIAVLILRPQGLIVAASRVERI